MEMLPIEVVERIWKAAGTGAEPSKHQAAIVREWLTRSFAGAKRRAKRRKVTTPLTQKEIDGLKSAYHRFCAAINGLQDRDYAPPLIPKTDNITDWEYWISAASWGIKRGRHGIHDWTLIEALLELYEVITDRPASGADERNPTMRFLDEAFEAFADVASPDTRSYFQPPSADAVRRELPKIREAQNGQIDRRLKGFRS